MPTRFSSVADIEAHVGKVLGSSEYREMPFSQIVAFAEATGDHQWIHVDREKAENGPFGAPIAHGYLTLSLVAGLFSEVLELDGFKMIINYGCNKVRFPNPMKENARYRLTLELQSFRPVKDWIEMIMGAAIEVEGEDKPAVFAEVVFRVLPE
ncbi:MAG: MaoC family dehydratase [Myxococcota bacterium]